MIQEIAPHSYDNAYRALRPAGDDLTLVFDADRVLCALADGELDIAEKADLRSHLASCEDCAALYRFQSFSNHLLLERGGLSSGRSWIIIETSAPTYK